MIELQVIERKTSTVAEFCSSIGIGKTRFYRDVREGNIKIIKVGRKTIVKIDQQEAYLRRMAGEED